jgi:hypothetical protein
VVVLSVADYERLVAPHGQRLSEFLRASPLTGTGLVVERASEPMRDPLL